MIRPKKQYNLFQDPASLKEQPTMNWTLAWMHFNQPSLTGTQLLPVAPRTPCETPRPKMSTHYLWWDLNPIMWPPSHVLEKRSIHQSNTSCKRDFFCFWNWLKTVRLQKSLATVPSQDHKLYICTKYDGLFMNYETVSDGYKVTVKYYFIISNDCWISVVAKFYRHFKL